MDAAYAALGRTSADFWDRRARRFHLATRDRVLDDPFYRRARRFVGRRTSVLDVGAGTGRFSLALAPLAAEVTAVEPNASMVGYLKADAAAAGLSNLDAVQARWEDTSGLRADVALCSHVLYPIEDGAGFLRRLDSAAQKVCLVYMRARHVDELSSPIWEEFHAQPRALPPTYIDAVNLLHELGILANVEMAQVRSSWSYDDLPSAVDEYLDQLIIRDTPDNRARLARLLRDWLVELPDGRLGLPDPVLPTAIIWWTKRRTM